MLIRVAPQLCQSHYLIDTDVTVTFCCYSNIYLLDTGTTLLMPHVINLDDVTCDIVYPSVYIKFMQSFITDSKSSTDSHTGDCSNKEVRYPHL